MINIFKYVFLIIILIGLIGLMIYYKIMEKMINMQNLFSNYSIDRLRFSGTLCINCLG